MSGKLFCGIIFLPSSMKSHLKPASAGWPTPLRYEQAVANKPENAVERLEKETKNANLC